MEKKREQELADQEALRLYREFHAPIPKEPPEREKPLDKVKEPEPGTGGTMTKKRRRPSIFM